MICNIPSILKNLIVYELKIIFRNRRPRNTLLFYIIGYVAVILLYLTRGYQIFLYNYILISSVYFMYGALMFAWESKYYDSIYSKNIKIKDIVTGKILLLQLINIVFFLLLVPFLWLEPAQLVSLTLLTVYNIGIYPYTDVLLASYNKKKVRLYRCRTFNLEGYAFLSAFGAYKTIAMGIVIIVITEIVPSSFKLIVPGILGTAGLFNILLFSKFWITRIEDNLNKRKYLMLEGFRHYD
jgi:hypothetical protein